MTDLIVTAILVAVIAAAAGYVYKAKKSGVKCIGCPSGKSCSGNCSGGCGNGSNSCSCHTDNH